ncbi:hypothetical protein NM688_g3863 [Phlebia brevispora]|uniref:Uncharacterized protein n=1 Tax=Phlebia brevispora TaxID=194682 RepID=A0ACC1T4J1_9APHY|nr:hypothetical protein NM688_g3863 [Phlebia brevispora]
MSEAIELDDLKARRGTSPSIPAGDSPRGGPRLNLDANQEQAVALWAYVTTALLMIIAIPMIFFPSVLLYIAETNEDRRNTLTPLEAFLALHSGILLVAFAMGLLFNVPASSSIQVSESSPQPHPLLVPLTTSCALIAFISYNTTSVGHLATLVFLGSATVAIWGIWTILFAGTSYISRKTGADKRTSRFLFGNKAAASSQKKEWKKHQGAK